MKKVFMLLAFTQLLTLLKAAEQEKLQWFWLQDDAMTAEEAGRLTASGIPKEAKPFSGDLAGSVDFAALAGKPVKNRRPILLLAELRSDREKTVFASAGADFFYAFFCNGKLCDSTLEFGNDGTPASSSDRVFGIPLKCGKNLLGFYVQSGARGWIGGMRFQPDTKATRLRFSRQAEVARQFPAKGELRYGPWITHVDTDRAAVRFNTDGNQAVCVDYRKAGASRFRRSYELWNGHFRYDIDRHCVELKNLEPGTLYEFRIGVIPKVVTKAGHLGEPQQPEMLEPLYRFRTLPAAGKRTRLFVTSDTHVACIAKADLLLEAEKRFGITGGDVMIHLGDIATTLDRFDDAVLGGYTSFFCRGGKVTPLATAQGNHEHCGAENIWWNHAFASPTGENYYAFRSGDCLIAVMDYWGDPAERIPSNLSERYARQREWFDNLLRSETFRTAKYRILCNHCPPTHPVKPGKQLDRHSVEVRKLLSRSKELGAQWSLMLCGHCHTRFVEKLDGVTVVCLGGGYNRDAVSIADIEADGKSLRFRLSSVSGKPFCDFSLPPCPEREAERALPKR